MAMNIIECDAGCDILWPQGQDRSMYPASPRAGSTAAELGAPLACSVCGDRAVARGEAAEAEARRLLAEAA